MNATAVKTTATVAAPTRNLYQRWNAVLADIDSISKLGKNKEQGYDYMKNADLLKELRPLLAKHGLVLKTNPVLETIDDSEYQSTNGKSMHFVRLATRHWLINIDDPTDRDELFGIGDASDSSDKAVNKARTGALKFVLRDNFLIDDQSSVIVEAEKETPERAGPQNRVGAQSRPASAAPPVVTQKFEGVVLERGEGGDEATGRYVWIQLHNQNEKLYDFRVQDFDVIREQNRITITCTQKLGKQGRPYWMVTDLVPPPLTPDFISHEKSPDTPTDVLKRMFPGVTQIKYRRLVFEAIKDLPLSLHIPILLSFERRLANEKPSSDLGLLALLDISKAEAEEAGNVN